MGENIKGKKEPWFPMTKKERKLLFDPINDDNPVTVQILGVCSALAVTTMMLPSIVMAIAVTLVVAFSNLAIALIRDYIPKQVRMIVQLVVIAFLVTIVELILKAYSFPVWKQLSVFIGLIITNCIVMGRLEAFAMSNKPWQSFLDGIGNGLGYGLILIIISVIREFFGRGTLMSGSPLEMKIIGASSEFWINTSTNSLFSWYSPNGMMVMPASAIFLMGLIIWYQRGKNRKLIDIS
ncbi:MAG: NADH:ubiquinone reductase (Na(+)-transporting) subunit D [Deltaproteobacteria bacterium]